MRKLGREEMKAYQAPFPTVAGGKPIRQWPRTHDLELIELLGTDWTFGHFSEQIESSGISFDYSLREPGCQTGSYNS